MYNKPFESNLAIKIMLNITTRKMAKSHLHKPVDSYLQEQKRVLQNKLVLHQTQKNFIQSCNVQRSHVEFHI